jgi:hypothetical protein
MYSTAERDIRRHVSQYLLGDLSVRDLRVWTTQTMLALDRTRDANARTLAGRVLLYISEYGLGHRTPRELDRLLTVLIEPAPVFSHGSAVETRTINVYVGTTDHAATSTAAQQVGPAETGFQAVFA